MTHKDKEIIQSLLEIKEWHTFDCKRALIKPSKLLETVVAFANTDGGIIAIGIEDPKKASGNDRLFGISESKSNVSEFLKLIDKEIDPFLNDKSKIELTVTNNRSTTDNILVIKIGKSTEVHSLKNGDTYVRKGDQNVKIGNIEITRLKYEKGTIHFEEETSRISDISELDLNLLKKFKEDNNSRNLDNFQVLKDNGLALKNNNSFELTKACILLFANNPSVSLKNKYGIKISHYYGTEQNFTGEPNFVRKPFTIEGPLLIQIEKAIEYYRSIVQSAPLRLKGATFRSTMMIPEWAYQEAITNAVIHRNYSIQDDIHVRFFDDRIEIESPGSYPAFITPSNIKNERFARNPIIQRTLNRFNSSPNLDIGEGVDRMFEVMKDLNLYEPLYFPANYRPNSVLLILFNLQKITYWDTVSKYLDKNYQITNSVARTITGIKDTIKMSRLLKDWVNKRLLHKIQGNYKGDTFYRKPGVEIPVSFANDNENGDI